LKDSGGTSSGESSRAERTVLVVSYAWPPAGGPGVQRVLKFVKYLPSFGFRPVVLTVKEGTYPALDHTLERDVPEDVHVYRSRSTEPASLYKRFVGMKADQPIPVAVLAEPSTGIKKRIANYIRLNLFVPDAKIGWYPWAVREGHRLVKAERPSIVFSTAPPPTTHLVARAIAMRHRLPWVADFRDPWTDVHYYEGSDRLPITRAIDHRLERSVFESASRLTFVSRLDSERYTSVYGHPEKHAYIPNGYDEADFESIASEIPDPSRFTLMHLGSVGLERCPTRLFAAIKRLAERGIATPATFRLTFVGKVEPSVRETIRESGVEPFVEFIAYVPHHEALRLGQRAHALLLLITQSQGNAGILPGKTFEYLRYGRPLLALGPIAGEVGLVLRDTKGGAIHEYDDTDGMTATLEAWIRGSQSGRLPQGPEPERLERYSRKSLTGELAAILAELT
jgi:glycosyltransferase involved in cell wall biosynthesis